MHLSSSDIFWKSWWWSLVFGACVGIFFYAVTAPFHWSYGGASFVDLLIAASIAGCYFGAGYVGWRISYKYYHVSDAFIKRYRQYGLLTFILLVAITYSPLSFLGVLWSFIPPFCVLQTLRHIKQKSNPKQRK